MTPPGAYRSSSPDFDDRVIHPDKVAELLQRYSETVAQLRASGWSEAKIIDALQRKAEREAR